MPCSHGNRTPQEMYEQAIKCRDEIFTVFGRTAKEILNALELWDNAKEPHLSRKRELEQKPMTREEAVETCSKYAMQYPRVFVDCLAALGLLKFEEVPKKHCLLCKQSFNENEVKNYMCSRPDCTTFIKQKPVKQVEWRHTLGNVCWFSEGYDPNKSDSGWRRVVPEESEIVRLPVDNRTYEIGSDTYGVKVESIVKALQKAGYRIYKGAYANEVKKQEPVKPGDFIKIRWADGSYTQGVVDRLERS